MIINKNKKERIPGRN